jgi:acetyltransferase
MLARFTQIDYDREMALVALAGKRGAEREIGVCRYATMPGGTTCEYAIAIADEWQGKGLGWILMRRLIGAARSRGLDSMEGYVHASNGAMLGLCRKLGFANAPEPGDPRMRRVTLALGA